VLNDTSKGRFRTLHGRAHSARQGATRYRHVP
jgi:hypothetical protein